MRASSKGHVEVVKALLSAGSYVNLQAKYRMTPLMVASFFGKVEVVKLLLSAKAKVNLQNKDGKTALCYAKKPEIKQLLKDAGGLRICPSS